MSHQIVWTQSALEDLQEILSEHYADQNQVNPLEEEAFLQAEQLEQSPHLGPVFAPLGKPYRHLVVHPSYRLIYLPRETQIFILAFVHTRRQFHLAWKDRPRFPGPQ